MRKEVTAWPGTSRKFVSMVTGVLWDITLEASICQGSILPYDMTLQETRREIPWTIQNPCMSRHPFHHSTASRQSLCRPNIPCFYAGTSNSESDSWLHSTPTSANHCWWWTGFRNFRNTRLQDWQPPSYLQTTVSCLLDRVWGYWQRNLQILTSKLGHTSKLIVEFHSAYSVKPGPLSSLSWLWFCNYPVFFISWRSH